jgi:signal transduction histidine kinase
MTIPQEIQDLEARLVTITDPREQADAILILLDRYVNIRSTDGEPYIDRLLQIAGILTDTDYRAWAFFYGSIIARYKGEYSSALELSAQALQLFTSTGNQRGISSCHNNAGLIYRLQGNYAESLKSHLQALKVREEINDKGGIAMSYSNIGMIYYWQGNYTGALESNTHALQLLEEVGDKRGVANALSNIGHSHYAELRYDDALANHLQSQQIHIEVGNEYGIALAEGNIGIIYRCKGDHEQALSSFESSLIVSEKLGNKHNISSLLGEIGKTYYEQEKYDEAINAYLRALQISEEIGAKEEILAASEGLMKIYRIRGDYKLALRYNDQYHKIDKEMTGQQAQRQMVQLNFQHDIDLKEKEAKLLKEKNEAISVYAHRLEVSNNALNQFAHVASHDLREPLRMVSSYMDLLEKTMGDNIQPVQRQFIGFAVDGAKRMEQLIHDLLRLAKVDANPHIEQVALHSIVDTVRSNLEILLSEKNARIITTDLPTLNADRTQLMQLFQNIISNGIKYNENEAPTITIDYEQRDKDGILSIADNGIGIAPEYREKAFQIFQRLPTAKQYQGSGIGLAICKKIVDGLGGTIAIEDNPTGGTVFYITVPVSLICHN